MTEHNWRIYTGASANDAPNESDDARAHVLVEALAAVPIYGLPDAPPWRQFGDVQRDERRGKTFKPTRQAIDIVNAALYLRRPLLVTGKPGTGKSSLVYAVAQELQLGTVLKWPINTRTTLRDGLYLYDAIARLRDAQLTTNNRAHEVQEDAYQQIGRYIRLGPLGTALLPRKRPRVLLIDEIDKSDIDLPNDLLNVFEEGEFTIPELTRQRLSKEGDDDQRDPHRELSVAVTTDDNYTVPISDGRVRCDAFPFVVMTSNGERDFPPAFLRRCLQLNMEPPSPLDLEEIVVRHLGAELYEQSQALIKQQIELFIQDRETSKGDLATDQLLNLIYLLTRDVVFDGEAKDRLVRVLKQKLRTDGA